MAGIFGGTGILGGQQNGGWGSTLGILGAGLADAGANFSGHPADANNLAPLLQRQQQMQQTQALMAAVNSSDPNVRQQAYSIMPMLGMDPAAFQKAQASQALPKLMDFMQPQEGVKVTPKMGALGAGDSVAARTASGAYDGMSPGQSLPQALQSVGSPELTAQMGPEIIKQQLAEQDKRRRPMTLAELKSAGLPDGTAGEVDNFGNITVLHQSDVPSQGKLDSELWLKNHDPNLPIARQNANTSSARLKFEQDKLDANIPDESTLHDMAVRYVHGDKTAFGAMGRNPRAQTAAQNMISQVGREQGLKPEQVSQNQQTFQAAGKTVDAFDRGKQGDTVRSLNVSVSHLDTLRELGKALNNGDVRAINAAKQRFAEEFGVAAPMNFDAAKSIVADEVAKGVIGGQSAQSDRETLAASLRRSGSPQAIDGAISTFQELLGGQLRGLRQQYKSSTGREDFNDKLFPATIAALDKPKNAQGGKPLPGTATLPKLPVKITGDADYAKLPSGAEFIGPDGVHRRKP